MTTRMASSRTETATEADQLHPIDDAGCGGDANGAATGQRLSDANQLAVTMQQQQHQQQTPQQQDLIQLLAQHFHQQFYNSQQLTPATNENLATKHQHQSRPAPNTDSSYHLQRYQCQQQAPTSVNNSLEPTRSPRNNGAGLLMAANQQQHEQLFQRHLFGQQNNLAHMLSAAAAADGAQANNNTTDGPLAAANLSQMLPPPPPPPFFPTPSALESFLSLAQRAGNVAQQPLLANLIGPQVHHLGEQQQTQGGLLLGADLSLLDALGFGSLASNQFLLSLQQQHQQQSIAAAAAAAAAATAANQSYSTTMQQQHQLTDNYLNDLTAKRELSGSMAGAKLHHLIGPKHQLQSNGTGSHDNAGSKGNLKFSINTILGQSTHSSSGSSSASSITSPPIIGASHKSGAINELRSVAQHQRQQQQHGQPIKSIPSERNGRVRDQDNDEIDLSDEGDTSCENGSDDQCNGGRRDTQQQSTGARCNVRNATRNRSRVSVSQRRLNNSGDNFLLNDSRQLTDCSQPPIDCSSSNIDLSANNEHFEVDVDSNSSASSKLTINEDYRTDASPRDTPIFYQAEQRALLNAVQAKNNNQECQKNISSTGTAIDNNITSNGQPHQQAGSLSATDIMHQNTCLGLLAGTAAARSAAAAAQNNMHLTGNNSLRVASLAAHRANRQHQQQQNHLQHQNHLQSQHHQPGSLVNPLPLLTGSTAFPWTVAARGKPRRGMMRRAVFSDSQRVGLEKRFQMQKYISKPDRKKLAEKLGLRDSQVKIWFQNRRMKWRNSKERELLSAGGSREQTLPTRNNPNPDLSDVGETIKRLTSAGGANNAKSGGDNENNIYTGTDLLRNSNNNNNVTSSKSSNKDSDIPKV